MRIQNRTNNVQERGTGFLSHFWKGAMSLSILTLATHAQPVESNLGIDDEASYQAFKEAMYKSEYLRTDYARNPNPRVVASVTAMMVFASINPNATSQELEDYLDSYSSSLSNYAPGDADLVRSSSFLPALRLFDRGAPTFTHTGLDLRVSDRLLEVLDVDVPDPLDFESTRQRMVDFENARVRSFANSPDWSLILMLGLYGQDLDGHANTIIPDVIVSYLIAEGFEVVPDGVDDARFTLTTSALTQMPSSYSQYSLLLADVNANPTSLESTALQGNIQASYEEVQSRNADLILEIHDAMINPPSLIEAAENAMDPNFLAQQEAAYEQDLLAVSDERVTLNWNSMMILQSNQQDARDYATWSRSFSHIQLETDDTLAKVKLGIEVASGLTQFGIAVASGEPGDAIGALSDYVLASIDLADAFGSSESPDEQIFDQIVALRQDVEDMRVEMHDRFDHVEEQLDLIFVSMMNSFNQIGDNIGDLQDDVSDLRRSIAVQRAALERIEDALYGMVGDVMWNDLIQKIDLVLNYRSEFGADFAYEGSISFINSASALKTWTVSTAANSVYAGPVNSSLTTENATEILGGSSIGRNVNDLRVFPATLGLPILFNDRVVASAPWTQAASVYTQLASESPWYFAYMYENQTQGPGVADLNTIIDKGQDLLAMMENGRDEAIFDELFLGYAGAVADLSAREEEVFDSINPAGVDAFGGLTQPTAMNSAPPMTQILGRYANLPMSGVPANWNIFRTNNGEQDIAVLTERLVSNIMATQYPGELPVLSYEWAMNIVDGNEVFMHLGFTIDGNNGHEERGLRVQTNRALRIKVYEDNLSDPILFNASQDAEDFFGDNFGVWWRFRDLYLTNGQNLTGELLVINDSPFGGNTLIEVVSDSALSDPSFPHVNGRAKALEFLEELQVEAWQAAQSDSSIEILTDQLHDWAALIEAYATLSLPDLIAESTVASSALRGSPGEHSFALAVDVAARYGINANDPGNAIMISDRSIPNMTKTADSFALWLDKPFPGHGYINFMMAELNELRDFAFDLAIDDRYLVSGGISTPAEEGLLANDVGQQYRHIQVSSFTLPNSGSLFVNPDGSFEYTPEPGLIGTASFSYTSTAEITQINGQPQFFESSPAVVMLVVNQAPCLADLTGDGSLNFFDVSAFLQAFGSNDPVADLNDDGLWNFFDVSVFLQAFNEGCP